MGTNVNYDPDFDACKTEIGKLGDIDYSLIEKSCRAVLSDKSKDIRVLSFLSFVYLRDAKWESLADVYEGFSELAKNNFDTMFPDRPRARQNAIQWLGEIRYNEAAALQKPVESDYNQITRLVAALANLKKVLEEKFPEGSPFPSGFFGTVQNWEKAIKPKPQVAPQGVVGVASVSGTPGATAADPMDTPKQAQAIAKKAAQFLIEKEPQKSMGFRLMRSLRWDIFEKAPPNENGKTQLAPPPADLVASLNNLLNNKEFKSALDKAESGFAGAANHLWINLQRSITLACAGLGDEYKPVEQAILFETGMFIKRIPEITNLSFSDGTPFCDDAVKDWIKTQVMPLFSQGNASGTTADGAEAVLDKIEEEKKQVAVFSSSNQTEKALEFLQNAIRNSSNERDNFKRSILIANLLTGAKQPDIALSILDALLDKIQSYHLDIWDPDLAVEAWSLMVKVIKLARANKAAPVQASMTEKLSSILSKISQLDPKKAFSLNS